MPGFNRSEQQLLSYIVGGHRRRFTTIDKVNVLPKGWRKRAAYLALVLRLAVLFNRSRTSEFPDLLGLSVDDRVVKLRLSRSWLELNPLTLADLEMEQEYLQAVNYDLQLITV